MRYMEGGLDQNNGLKPVWFELYTGTSSRLKRVDQAPDLPDWHIETRQFGSWIASYQLDTDTLVIAALSRIGDEMDAIDAIATDDKDFRELTSNIVDKTFTITMFRKLAGGHEETVSTTVQLEEWSHLAEVMYLNTNLEQARSNDVDMPEKIGLDVLADFLDRLDAQSYGPEAHDSSILASLFCK